MSAIRFLFWRLRLAWVFHRKYGLGLIYALRYTGHKNRECWREAFDSGDCPNDAAVDDVDYWEPAS